MALIFDPQYEGSVAVLTVGQALPSAIKMDDLDSASMILTSVAISQQANVQLAPTLLNSLYIYSFGDQIGSIRVGGVGFNKPCNETAQRPPSADGFAGLQSIYDYYEQKSLARTLQPIVLSLGTFTIRCFMLGFQITTESPQLSFMRFMLDLIVPPAQTTDGARQ